MEIKYLEKFKALVESGKHPLLHGNRMLVEVLPKDEIKSAGGIIVQTVDTHKTSTEENRPCLCVILQTGAGYEDESGVTVPLPYQQGEIVLVPHFSLKYYSQFPGMIDFTKERIALVRDTDIHMSWTDLNAYEEYKKQINSL